MGKLQVIASVTSEVQIDNITKMSKGSFSAIAVSNRDLETFNFDESGEQALRLLQSDALASFRNVHGEDIPTFVEGRVGIIDANDGSGESYIEKLKDAGA